MSIFYIEFAKLIIRHRLKIMFIAFLLRMVIAFFNIDDLGKMINFFLEPVEKILILVGFLVAGRAVPKYRWELYLCFLNIS